MSNNAPDYEDDFVFEPAMTWEQLVEWVKNSDLVLKCNITMESKDWFMLNNIFFNSIGNVLTDGRCFIADNRSPEQMQTIIKTLFEE